jgi:hypothetical protein
MSVPLEEGKEKWHNLVKTVTVLTSLLMQQCSGFMDQH